MHLYLVVKGNLPRVKHWANDLLAMYFPYEHKKGEKGALQLGVRPVQLYELAFPEAVLKTVLETVQPHAGNKRLQAFAFFLRKLLGCKPIKIKWEARGEKALFKHIHKYVDVIPVGIREDRKENEVEMI